MESNLLIVFVASLIGSLFSLVGGIILLSRRLNIARVQFIAVPFAAGALLAATFSDLLPEAFELGEAEVVSVTMLLGFLFFFCLERFLSWFHHHHEHDASHRPTALLVIIGDTLHNFIDGALIGAAFLIDPVLGAVTTLAIAAHEIPQEIGDFGLLLSLGLRRKTVLFVNIFSAFATVVSAVGVYSIGGTLESAEPLLLAITAGFFLYIAAADLIPTIHGNESKRSANIQTAILLLGCGFVFLITTALHTLLH